MKKILILLIAIWFVCNVSAQSIHSDTTKKWFAPTHGVLLYAGNMGFLSAGIGYDWCNDKLSLDILLGYLPESIGGISITTLNTKFTYKPWDINLNNSNFSIVPFHIGFFTSHAFGEQYTKFKKSGDYPQGYYWWPNSTRVGLSLGQNLFYLLPEKSKIRTIELFWELGAEDLSIYSAAENKVVKGRHILALGIGSRIYF